MNKINSQKGFVVPLVIAIVAILVAGGAYMMWKNKAPVAATNDTASSSMINSTSTAPRWQYFSTRLDSGTAGLPTLVQFRYPMDWKTTSYEFPCPTGSFFNVAVMSPVTYDVPGHEATGANYLIQYCVSKNGIRGGYGGFIEIPKTAQTVPTAISLSDADLMKTNEAKQVETIESTFATYTSFIDSINPSSSRIGSKISISGSGLKGSDAITAVLIYDQSGMKGFIPIDHANSNDKLISFVLPDSACVENKSDAKSFSNCEDNSQIIPGTYSMEVRTSIDWAPDVNLKGPGYSDAERTNPVNFIITN
jgi:hypothetical protein